MDWRVHYLLVKSAVAEEVLKRVREFVHARCANAELGKEEGLLTPDEAKTLSQRVALVIKELSVGEERKGVVNVYFTECCLDLDNTMVLDVDAQVLLLSFF